MDAVHLVGVFMAAYLAVSGPVEGMTWRVQVLGLCDPAEYHMFRGLQVALPWAAVFFAATGVPWTIHTLLMWFCWWVMGWLFYNRLFRLYSHNDIWHPGHDGPYRIGPLSIPTVPTQYRVPLEFGLAILAGVVIATMA